MQCALFCLGGLCSEAFDGYVFCSGCNTTTSAVPPPPPHKLEECRDAFNNASMDEWTIFRGKSSVSSAGLTADIAAEEAEAIIDQHQVADFIYEADILMFPNVADAGASAGVIFRANKPDKMQDKPGGYYYAGVRLHDGSVFLQHTPSGVELASLTTTTQVLSGQILHTKLQAVNETMVVYVGDDMRMRAVEATGGALRAGFNGVRVQGGAGPGALFSNLSIVPMMKQRGFVDNCNAFHRAVEGDTCDTMAAKHDALSLQLFHSWNPSLQDDCSGLKTDYFYRIGRTDAFRVRNSSISDCSGDVLHDVVVSHDDGTCISTGCSIGSLEVAASVGDCPDRQVQISYWEQPGCKGKWFGYDYTSRDSCQSLWSRGHKFRSLRLRCADAWYGCVGQGGCVPDKEPALSLC